MPPLLRCEVRDDERLQIITAILWNLKTLSAWMSPTTFPLLAEHSWQFQDLVENNPVQVSHFRNQQRNPKWNRIHHCYASQKLSNHECFLGLGFSILQITFTTFMATPAFSYRCRNHICAFFRTVFLSLWILAWTWRMGTDGVHQQNLTFFQTSEFTMLNHEWTHWISADFSCNFSTILNPENTFLFVIMSIIFLP